MENYANAQAGKTMGILLSVIGLGDKAKTWKEETKVKPIVKLSFELPAFTKEDGKPATVNSSELPVYAFEKASIAPYFKALGIEVTKDHSTQDMIELLGKAIGTAVELDVDIKEVKLPDGKEIRYNYIVSIEGKKYESVPKLVNQETYYTEYVHGKDVFDKLPDHIKPKISPIKKDEAIEVGGDDLPF